MDNKYTETLLAYLGELQKNKDKNFYHIENVKVAIEKELDIHNKYFNEDGEIKNVATVEYILYKISN